MMAGAALAAAAADALRETIELINSSIKIEFEQSKRGITIKVPEKEKGGLTGSAPGMDPFSTPFTRVAC
jgi:hypothetical protein